MGKELFRGSKEKQVEALVKLLTHDSNELLILYSCADKVAIKNSKNYKIVQESAPDKYPRMIGYVVFS